MECVGITLRGAQLHAAACQIERLALHTRARVPGGQAQRTGMCRGQVAKRDAVHRAVHVHTTVFGKQRIEQVAPCGGGLRWPAAKTSARAARSPRTTPAAHPGTAGASGAALVHPRPRPAPSLQPQAQAEPHGPGCATAAPRCRHRQTGRSAAWARHSGLAAQTCRGHGCARPAPAPPTSPAPAAWCPGPRHVRPPRSARPGWRCRPATRPPRCARAWPPPARRSGSGRVRFRRGE